MAWHWPGQLTAAGAKTLCAALRDCKTLLVLDLGTNSIGDAGPLGPISSHLIHPLHPSAAAAGSADGCRVARRWLSRSRGDSGAWRALACGLLYICAFVLLHICAFVLLHICAFVLLHICAFAHLCSCARACGCARAVGWVGGRVGDRSVSKLGWLAYAAPARRRAFCSQAHTHECVALRELLR